MLCLHSCSPGVYSQVVLLLTFICNVFSLSICHRTHRRHGCKVFCSIYMFFPPLWHFLLVFQYIALCLMNPFHLLNAVWHKAVLHFCKCLDPCCYIIDIKWGPVLWKKLWRWFVSISVSMKWIHIQTRCVLTHLLLGSHPQQRAQHLCPAPFTDASPAEIFRPLHITLYTAVWHTVAACFTSASGSVFALGIFILRLHLLCETWINRQTIRMQWLLTMYVQGLSSRNYTQWVESPGTTQPSEWFSSLHSFQCKDPLSSANGG